MSATAATYRAIQLQRFAASFREATAIVDLPVAAPGPGEIRGPQRLVRG